MTGVRARPVRLALAMALAIATLSTSAHAHPLHTTMTELRFDARTHTVRATIHAYLDDFGRAVSRLSPDAAPPTQVSDSAAIAYIRGHFAITTQDGRGLPLRGCGIELRGDAYLICVEAGAAGRMEGMRIQNRMHTELYQDQINIVQATDGGARATLLFTREDGPKTLRS